jgi:trk system potassium uptake protein TrkA
MNFIVVGCGRVGAELAYRLFQNGHTVTVIDPDPAAFNRLNPNFRGRTIEGEALNRDILYRAGIEKADGLAAVTNSDTVNAVVSHIARSQFKIPTVIARNYDPHHKILMEAFELQVISSTSWGAQRIEELLYHGTMHTVFSAGNGEVEIYEFSIPESWAGHTLRDLIADSEATVAAVTRAGQSRLPSPELVLQAGDVILVSATFNGIEFLQNRIFKEAQET